MLTLSTNSLPSLYVLPSSIITGVSYAIGYLNLGHAYMLQQYVYLLLIV